MSQGLPNVDDNRNIFKKVRNDQNNKLQNHHEPSPSILIIGNGCTILYSEIEIAFRVGSDTFG